MKLNLYLDDIRTPSPNVSTHQTPEWVVVRSYDEFVSKILEVGIHNIGLISLDHDLGDTATKEYFTNVSPNYTLDYSNIEEKTGYDCAKWLVNAFLDSDSEWFLLSRTQKKNNKIPFPTVMVHSANPIGSANIMGYINNFLMNEGQTQTCVRWNVPHTVETTIE